MKKIARTTGTLGTAAALSLGVGACSKPPTTPAPEPPSTVTEGATETPAATPAEPEASAAATDPTQKPDCSGKDQFTEACGYASPTKYAALDPHGIRNA